MTTKQALSDLINDLKKKSLHRKSLSCTNQHLNFSSNDYLSLCKQPEIIEAYQKGYELYGSGSRASMVLGGYAPIHQELENNFADFFEVESAVLFTSGYAANLCILALLKKLNSHCIVDKRIHASVYDGLFLNKNDYERYHHNDIRDLELKLEQSPSYSCILTEGIFSMGGQKAPLAKIAELSKTYQSHIIIDEAHSVGLLGHEGKGAVFESGIEKSMVPLRVAPLGKAFAGQGAVVAGNKLWIDALVQFGRSYIYSTGMSPALAFGLKETLSFIKKADDLRSKLHQLIDCFRYHVQSSTHHWADSYTPIQQLYTRDSAAAIEIADYLSQQEIFCLPVRPPTVTETKAGLRVVLNAEHSEDQLLKLIQCINQYYEYKH